MTADKKVYFSQDTLPFLSNFWKCSRGVTILPQWPRITFQTSEHAYQAHKSLYLIELGDMSTSLVCLEAIRNTGTPGQAKRLANSFAIDTQNWNKNKVRIMRECLFAKFSQNPDLLDKLLKTEPLELIEYAPHGDIYWGVNKNLTGKNMMGKLLMEVRTYYGSNRLL